MCGWMGVSLGGVGMSMVVSVCFGMYLNLCATEKSVLRIVQDLFAK